jgi:predicted ester cyclase
LATRKLNVPAKGDPSMSLEEMKKFVKDHFEDFVNRKKAEVALKNMSPDFLDHDEMNGPQVGPEAAMNMMKGMYKMFPDLNVTVVDSIAQDDKVMVRNVWRGTGKNGKKIEFHGFVLWRIANKKLVERWATITAPSEESKGWEW